MEMRKKEVFEWNDCKVELSGIQSQKVLLKNPEALRSTSVSQISDRLINTFGKYEFEAWVAEKVAYAALKAMVEGNDFADLTKIAHASFWLGYKEWVLVLPTTSFKERFFTLPIFNIVKREEDEVILEFVLK